MFLFSKILTKVFFAARVSLIFFSSSLFAIDTASDLLDKDTTRYDITYQDTSDSNLTYQKIITEVEKVAKEVDKIISLIPRVVVTGICSSTGCNLDSVKCDAIYEDPICPNGGSLNTTRDMCQINPKVTCPNGYTWDKSIDKCISHNVCIDGGTLNEKLDRCEKLVQNDCLAGYTYDKDNDKCWKKVVCRHGSFNSIEDRCEYAFTKTCPSGYAYNSNNDRCEANPVCPSGMAYNKAYDSCLKPFTKTCPSGYAYNSNNDRCEANPVCPSGTKYNSYANKCETVSGKNVSISSTSYQPCERSQSHLIRQSPKNNWSYFFDHSPPGCAAGADVTIKKIGSKTYRLHYRLRSDYAWTPYVSVDVTLGHNKSGRLFVSIGWLRQPIYYYFESNRFHTYIRYGRDDGGFDVDFNKAVFYKLNCKNYTQAINYADLQGMSVCKGCGSKLSTNVLTQTKLSHLSGYGWKATISAGGMLSIEINKNKNKVWYKMSAETSSKTITKSFSGTLTDKISGRQGKYSAFINFKLTSNHLMVGGQVGKNINTNMKNYYTKVYSFSNLLCYAISNSCPSGYTLKNGQCIISHNPSCPSGGRFDGSKDKCYLSYNKTCPSNSTYYSALDMCKADPVCTEGVLDTASDKCYLAYTITCSYGNYDSNNKICYSSPVCNLGNYSSADKRCVATVTKNCGNYYTWNSSFKKCIDTPTCPKDQGYSLNSTIGYSSLLKECISDTQHDCVGNYTYSPLPIEKCEIVPICENGVYDNATNGCFNDKYKCPIDPSLPCLGVEKGNHWCSPWKCNQDNKCGYAYCLDGSPSNASPWMSRILLNNIQNIADGTCIEQKCDVVMNENISYCGTDSVCPDGFGVYEEDNTCYQLACPDGSFIGDDGNCYVEACPEGTTEQGDGTCK